MKIPSGVTLAKDERKVFAEVCVALGDRLIDADFYAVEAFCRSLCRWRRLMIQERKLADAGKDTYKIGTLLSSAQKALDSSLTKLILTPADRKKTARTGGTPGKKIKDNALMKMLESRN